MKKQTHSRKKYASKKLGAMRGKKYSRSLQDLINSFEVVNKTSKDVRNGEAVNILKNQTSDPKSQRIKPLNDGSKQSRYSAYADKKDKIADSKLLDAPLLEYPEFSMEVILNHPCKYCNKIIYINKGTIIEGKPMHFKCYKKEIQNNVLEIIKNLKFTGVFKGIDKETDMAYRKGYNNALKDLEKEMNKNG